MNWRNSTNRSIALVAGITILATISSCSSPNNALIAKISELMESETDSSKIFNNKKILFIIPRTGCSGCIALADSYIKKKYIDQSKANFMFTKIQSIKQLTFQFGNEVLNENNIMLDTLNRFSQGPLNSKYPIIVFFINDTIDEVSFLSPDKSSLIQKINENLIILNK